jgi:O-succinylbenzoic acid--CoA ligase
VRRLVALDAVSGSGFVDALRAAWDGGDAVLPVDARLPAPARADLLAAARFDEPVEDGDALVMATSGTSGVARLAVLTHAAVAASAAASSQRLAVDPAKDRWLSMLPLAHVGGLSVVTRALLTSTPLTFDEADPGATLTSMVPTQLQRDPMAASRFRAVLLGGSADWNRDRPANVVRTYGLTETGSGIAYHGRPLDGVEVRIGPDDEVFVRGPMLLRCYRDGSDPKDDEGWLPTGDAGWLDARDGDRLHVRGRIGDVIVTGGEKVWPDAVESLLRADPAVAEVAVIGRADPEWGQRVIAVVVPTTPSAPPTLDALRDRVKAALPAWCAPRELELADSLPKTALGKVRRTALG